MSTPVAGSTSLALHIVYNDNLSAEGVDLFL